MNSKELLEILFQSSSLRQDLLDHIKDIIYDIIGNIDLSDEICARINQNTYDFLKEYNCDL